MQRGYCAVSTKYSPALIQQQALASTDAFLKVKECASLHVQTPPSTFTLLDRPTTAVRLVWRASQVAALLCRFASACLCSLMEGKSQMLSGNSWPH